MVLYNVAGVFYLYSVNDIPRSLFCTIQPGERQLVVRFRS